jgi:hypothetical protein
LPFDSVLIVSFGGPQGPADIRPFLANVLRGRRVSPERVEEVAHHYELFGGVSPITEVTHRQARGLQERLAALGHPLPVYVGMRNWHPLLPDTLREMHAAGLRHAVGFIAAAQHSYSSCQQYRENVMAARSELRRDLTALKPKPAPAEQRRAGRLVYLYAAASDIQDTALVHLTADNPNGFFQYMEQSLAARRQAEQVARQIGAPACAVRPFASS